MSEVYKFKSGKAVHSIQNRQTEQAAKEVNNRQMYAYITA